MTEPPLAKRQWWLAIVAALLASWFVYQEVGLYWGIGLALAVPLGFTALRYFRKQSPVKMPEIYCLRCGQPLPSTARECKSCGSASWSYRN